MTGFVILPFILFCEVLLLCAQIITRGFENNSQLNITPSTSTLIKTRIALPATDQNYSKGKTKRMTKLRSCAGLRAPVCVEGESNHRQRHKKAHFEKARHD